MYFKEKMRIALILENPITVGGGFNQALNAILQFQRVVGNEFEMFVVTTLESNIEYLEKIGIKVKLYSDGIFSKLINKIPNGQKIASKFSTDLEVTEFEKFLILNNADMAYFLTHSSRPNGFRKLPYITTVLDICHVDYPEFPEVSSNGQFQAREKHFATCLPAAALAIVASDSLVVKLEKIYNIQPDRMISMPFEPSPFFKIQGDTTSLHSELKVKYGISEGYRFYPAQYWAHKNHIRIIEALELLKKQSYESFNRNRFVFCGADHGNKSYLMEQAKSKGVNENIVFLDFVPVEHIKPLYEMSSCVVMPTYFGPTNIPPLEAWLLNKPLIYSAHIAEQIGSAALLINPDNYIELAEALVLIDSPEVASKLVKDGQIQLEKTNSTRINAEAELKKKLTTIKHRLECFNLKE
jgi:glycosyltransferase involved in cell wall biosynthesis